MLRSITFEVQLFIGDGDTRRSRKAMLWLLQGLVGVNRTWLGQYPGTPPLYDTKIVYEREVNTESWRDIPTLLTKGVGDCEDLACYRIAELNHWGIGARPYIKWRKNPQGKGLMYHAVVLRPDGAIEDPSKALGMAGHPITRKPVIVSR